MTYCGWDGVDLPAVSIQTAPEHLCRTGPWFPHQKMQWGHARCYSGQCCVGNLPSSLPVCSPGWGMLSSQPAMVDPHQRLCNNEESTSSHLVQLHTQTSIIRGLAFQEKEPKIEFVAYVLWATSVCPHGESPWRETTAPSEKESKGKS